MKKNLYVTILLFTLFIYFYDFVLCLWGKPLYDGTGHVLYIIAFHLIAILNYVIIGKADRSYNLIFVPRRPELFFVLHGSLISVFPYNGYLIAGFILMSAALIASTIRNIRNVS